MHESEKFEFAVGDNSTANSKIWNLLIASTYPGVEAL
jgi:hypothetical protein